MNIGFDLDNVFINTPPVIPHAIIERLYRKKADGILQYRIPSKREQLIRLASHIPIFRPPIKNNLHILQSIPKDKHKLFLISSRYSFLKNATDVIIKKHGLDSLFHELYFNYDNKQPHIYKDELIKTLKLEKYVDDDLHLLKYIASKNNKVKLYWLNKKLDKKISMNITAITNLAHILRD